MSVKFQMAEPFEPLFQPARYKVFYGGRGSGKSWAYAQALILMAMQKPLRVLCARELQVSIADSVHKLLADTIDRMGLSSRFEITRQAIRSVTGTEFIFKGLRHNATEIKSLEGVDYCWVEEGQSVSKESWDLLIPTIRKQGSEIWISFNPGRPDDETYKRFVLDPPDDAIVVKVGYQDNPWFPDTLRREMEYCRRVSPDDFRHIWDGEPSVLTEAQVFKGRYVVEPFETPEGARFFFGADWGFAADPSTLVRCFIKGDRLYIDYEAYGVGVELDETPQLFDSVPGSRKWPIKADSARPETISYMKRQGYNISAAKKWPGSVEDGLAYLKSFEKIIVHPRCRHTAEEFQLYSYKVDKNNGDILPVLVDAWNHCIAEGTLISTERGQIPVEDVTAQDKVLTRDGYKQVKFCGVTDTYRYCIELSLCGHSLLCTPDHKVFVVGKGFIEAGKIKQGDLLCVQCGLLNLNTGDLSGGVTQKPSGDVTGFIINACKKMGSLFGCIGMFGSKQTVQFLRGMLSITKMGTRKIMRLITLSAYRQRSIAGSTLLRGKGMRSNASTLTKLDISQRHGTRLKKVEQSIVRLAGWLIKILSRRKSFASNAENRSCQRHLGIGTYFVQTLANQLGGGNSTLTRLNAFANGAERNSCITNSKYQTLAAVPVRTISCGKIVERVYDISVDGKHEFFANGILVHNCLDALRYSLDGYIQGKSALNINNDVKRRVMLDRLRIR